MIPTLQWGGMGRRHRQAASGGGAAPTDIAGCTLWFDFTDTAWMFEDSGATNTVETDGDSIYTVKNRVDSSTWTRSSTSPTYETPGTGTGSATSEAKFPSYTSFYTRSGQALSGYITSSAFTAVGAVYIPSGLTGNTQSALLFKDSSLYLIIDLYLVAGSPKIRCLHWDTNYDSAQVTVSAPGWFIVSAQHLSGNIRIRVNRGAWQTTASGNTGSLAAAIQICPQIPSANSPGGTCMKHVAIYSAALSDDDIAAVENYMAADCGITL